MSDDQTLIDKDNGERIRDIMIKANQDRPPINLQDSVLYVPDNPEFWRHVAQRLRLAGWKFFQ